MTVFMLGADEQDAINAALERARKRPVPLAEVIRHKHSKQGANVLLLKDRPMPPPERHIEQVMLPFGYRLAISCEEQPVGFVAHLSLSSPAHGKVPRPEAMDMVLVATGLNKAEREVWLEEFDPGHFAVNVVALLPSRNPYGEGDPAEIDGT